MKLISWNVNGIRAVLKKGFLDYVKEENPDILCLQETKAHPDQVDKCLEEYPYHYWNSAVKKGYSGTAIFSKIKPATVTYGIGIEEHDQEGRIITSEYEHFILINVYTPNSKEELKRLEYRQGWDKLFLAHMKKMEKKKPVIVCGDLNVAHKEIDIARPKENRRNAGFTDEERYGMQQYIDNNFIDTFREFNTEGGNYTYWNQRFNARKNNTGWRIDYFLLSKSLRAKLKDAFIRMNILGSDHCPVGILLDLKK